MVVPDDVEPLVGWRVWSTVDAPGGSLLMSLRRPTSGPPAARSPRDAWLGRRRTARGARTSRRS
jgi:hypothetical protein